MNRNPSDHSDSEEDGYSSTEDEDDGGRRYRSRSRINNSRQASTR